MMSSNVDMTPFHKAIAILPKVGGSLSIIGSSLLLRDVVRKRQDVPLTTEVIANITVANLFIAFWECFLSTWMVPRDTSVAYMASGNTASCEAQGFITVVNLIVLEFSYTILSVLYWIMVAKGWTEQKTQRWKIRFFFLGLPIILALGFAIPMLYLRMYNFTGWFSCFLEEYPLNCDVDPDVECTRGATARDWQGGLFIFVAACTVVILVFMSLLVRAVRMQESKSDRYLTKGQKKRREMTNRAQWQAIRYISVFFVSNVPFYIFAVYDMLHQIPPDAITYIYAILWPMFGAFNSFAYFRPRYMSYRTKNPEKSCMLCLCTILDIDFMGSCCRKSDESVPPSVSELIEDDDLGSPLFREESNSVNGEESL